MGKGSTFTFTLLSAKGMQPSRLGVSKASRCGCVRGPVGLRPCLRVCECVSECAGVCMCVLSVSRRCVIVRVHVCACVC